MVLLPGFYLRPSLGIFAARLKSGRGGARSREAESLHSCLLRVLARIRWFGASFLPCDMLTGK
jgi:hypothetical protein